MPRNGAGVCGSARYDGRHQKDGRHLMETTTYAITIVATDRQMRPTVGVVPLHRRAPLSEAPSRVSVARPPKSIEPAASANTVVSGAGPSLRSLAAPSVAELSARSTRAALSSIG